MGEWLVKIFGNEWGTVVMSLVPLIELKGGIVFARSVGLSFWRSLVLAYFGSTVVSLPLFFLLKPFLNLLKRIKKIGGISEKIQNYFNDKAEQIKSNSGYSVNKKILAVFLFVAVPLPMTGVWTGTAIAVFLNFRFRDMLFPIAVGNLVAGIIISALVELCLRITGSTVILDYILWALFVLAFVILIITIVKVSKSNTKQSGEK